MYSSSSLLVVRCYAVRVTVGIVVNVFASILVSHVDYLVHTEIYPRISKGVPSCFHWMVIDLEGSVLLVN